MTIIIIYQGAQGRLFAECTIRVRGTGSFADMLFMRGHLR